MSQDTQSSASESEPKADQPGVLRGTSVAPGVALGRAFRKDYDLSQVTLQRIPRDQMERELNRFHSSLTESLTAILPRCRMARWVQICSR